jgi:hypothetical protein
MGKQLNKKIIHWYICVSAIFLDCTPPKIVDELKFTPKFAAKSQ